MKKLINEDIAPTSNTSSVTDPQEKNTTNITLNKKDLADTSVHSSINKIQGKKSINVVDEETTSKYKYLSNVKDSKTGDISQPFTINGKRYQIVRALSPLKEKVNAVFSLDESDDDGENIIHPMDFFEKNIVKPKTTDIKKPVMEDAPKEEDKKKEIETLSGYKYFLVNKKTKKFRKFKTAEALAKASMTPDEVFMSQKELKKFVNETIFGGRKKSETITEDNIEDNEINSVDNKVSNEVDNEGDGTNSLDGEVKTFINKIKEIPEQFYQKIKLNKIAQKKMVIAFSTFMGVPLLSVPEFMKLICNDFKNLISPESSKTQTGQDVGLFNESKVFKKSELSKLILENYNIEENKKDILNDTRREDKEHANIDGSTVQQNETLSEGQENKVGIPKGAIELGDAEDSSSVLNSKIENKILNIIRKNNGFIKRDLLTPQLYKSAMSDSPEEHKEVIRTIYQQSIDPKSRERFKNIVGSNIVNLALKLNNKKNLGEGIKN
jgi:hypothetical protein